MLAKIVEGQTNVQLKHMEKALDAWRTYLPIITKHANYLNDNWDELRASNCIPVISVDASSDIARRLLLDEIEYLEMYYPQWASTCNVNTLGAVQDAWVKAYAEELAEDEDGVELIKGHLVTKFFVGWDAVLALMLIVGASFMLGATLPGVLAPSLRSMPAQTR